MVAGRNINELKKRLTGLSLCAFVAFGTPVSAKIEFSTPGLSFVSKLPNYELANTPENLDSAASATVSGKKIGNIQTNIGLKLQDFVGNDSPTPTYQRRGSLFISGNYRYSPMIELELETGGYLGARDWGGYTTTRAYLDAQAIELKAEFRADVYKLKTRAKHNDSGLSWRTSGATEIILRGVGYLPSASELKIDADFEYDAGASYKGTANPQLYTKGQIRFDTSLNANPLIRPLTKPFFEFNSAFDLTTKLNWHLSHNNSDNAGLNNTGLNSTGTNRWLQASALTNFVLNSNQDLNFEALMHWSNQTNASHSQLRANHKWRITPTWHLSNSLGIGNFPADKWQIFFEPRIAYETPDWSLAFYAREKRILGDWANTTDKATTGRYQERALGSDFKFYTYNTRNQSIDFALTAEHRRLPGGVDSNKFGIKLDITD